MSEGQEDGTEKEFNNSVFGGVMDMKIREVNEDKKQFISLLLLADEQESMVDRYLEKGTMYVLEDNNVKAECTLLAISIYAFPDGALLF